jgi:hypothetical protein
MGGKITKIGNDFLNSIDAFAQLGTTINNMVLYGGIAIIAVIVFAGVGFGIHEIRSDQPVITMPEVMPIPI